MKGCVSVFHSTYSIELAVICLSSTDSKMWSKTKAVLYLGLSIAAMILGAEVISAYYGGSENVPQWAYYTYMIVALCGVGLVFARYLEVFKGDK
jgi:hypothetical protein